MKLIASFFVLLLVSSISIVSAASIISIEIDSNTLEAGEIAEINGSVESGLAGKPVGIEVKDSDGTIILIRSITLDSNGNNFQGNDDTYTVNYSTVGQSLNIVYADSTKGCFL